MGGGGVGGGRGTEEEKGGQPHIGACLLTQACPHIHKHGGSK